MIVLAFQDDGLSGVLDFRGNGGLEPSNLVLLFTVAFALASDYGVFLLGRIKEAHDAGLPNRDAIALGLERTGRLITAAALLFCVAVGALVSRASSRSRSSASVPRSPSRSTRASCVRCWCPR